MTLLFKVDFVIILLSVYSLIPQVITQDIIGCGGFVKSEVEINFSVIEVNALSHSQ